MADAELKVRIDADIGRLKDGLDKAKGNIKNFESSADKSLTSFGSKATSVFKLAALSIAGAFSVAGIIGFTKEVFGATAQYQKFGAVLGNTLGSAALANLKLKEIQDFAAKTPFGVSELTSAFVKLANQGFKPTGAEMRSLGDIASSMGKSFDQLAEAIIDAQVGEFERLKEFGIRAQDAGDKVIFTFKGVQTTVTKSSEAIREYITSLGTAEGVSGSMAVISQTLTGKVSNLGDSWEQMLISVGGNTSGIFSGAITILSSAIDAITEFNRELETASKFNIGGNFLETLAKYGGKAMGLTLPTTKDLKVDAILAVEKGVAGIVQSTVEGAKSAADFGNAIAKLKSEGDKLLKGGASKDVKDAFKSIYQDGIKALQDGRKAFQAELNRPAGKSFGTGGKDEKTQADVLKALDIALAKTEAAVDITFGEKSKEKINAFASAIDGIVEIGGDPNLIKSLQDKILNIDPTVLKAAGKVTGITISHGIGEGFAEAMPVVATDLGEKLKGGLTEWQSYVNDQLLPKLQSNFETFFNDILMNGKFSFESLGKAMLNSLLSVVASDAAKQFTNLFRYSEGTDADQSKGKGGIIGAVGSLFGGGKGEEGSGLGKGLGGILGTILPVAGIALGAASLLGGLFKKKKVDPTPAPSVTSSASNVGSADFNSGRVVFEISGVNLVGVLNRAGQKLQRFNGP